MTGNAVTDLEEFIQRCLNNIDFASSSKAIRAQVKEYFDRGGEPGDLVAVLRTNLTCQVCLEIPAEGCVTECKHVFCLYCIEMWCLTSSYCPVCRRELTEIPRRLPVIDELVDLIMYTHDGPYWMDRVEEDVAQTARFFTKYYTECMLDNMERMKKWIYQRCNRVHDAEAGVVDKVLEQILLLIEEYDECLSVFPITKENIVELQSRAKDLCKRFYNMVID